MTYIDPQVLPIIENMKNFRKQRGGIKNISPENMRINFNNDTKNWNVVLPEIANTVDFEIQTSNHNIPIRKYDPDPTKKILPTMIFIHGGGWIVGDLNTNERFLRLLSIRSGVRIVSVDYPLAPENPFPEGLDCIIEVCKIIFNKGEQWGIDTESLSIGGDSAGANLALCAAIDLKQTHPELIKYISLLYGALSPDSEKSSMHEYGQGEYGMGIEAMGYFWSLYLQDTENEKNPRAVPLLSDLTGLAETHIISAALDPIQDDSFDLAEKLRKSDVKYSHTHYPGMIHGFISLCLILKQGDKAISEMAANLRAKFNLLDSETP